MSETNAQTVIRLARSADRGGERVGTVARRAQRYDGDLIEARSGVDLHHIILSPRVHRARAARIRPENKQVVIVRQIGQLDPQPTPLLRRDDEAPDLMLLQP